MPSYLPKGSPTVLETIHVATTTALPNAPNASHHRGAQARVTKPQTTCAAPTTPKNAMFWTLPRPIVAAAAMLIAPASILAKAITVTIRAAFSSDSALAPLTRTSTGRDAGSVRSHRGCADISRSLLPEPINVCRYPDEVAHRFTSPLDACRYACARILQSS